MVLAGVLTLGLVLSLAPGAAAEHYEGTVEVQGATPVEAAVSFSRLAFPGGANEAALGRDDAFADSLASGVLQTTAPLLLTPTATLAPAVDSELKRLGVETVHILGGTSAISQAVEDQLKQAGYTVRRHRGATRIETAIEVAKAIAPSSTQVIVARAFGGGDDPTQAFADSLAAGAWSAGSGTPVLLTESERLSAALQAYLQSARPQRAYVVGGASAVSEATLSQIRSLGIDAQRVSGPTRFDTAVEIAKQRGLADASDGKGVVLLEGQAAGAWAPGFAAASYAAVERSAVLLVSGETIPAPTAAFLEPGDALVNLACGPTVPEAVCDEVAESLGKREAPKITLDQESIPQYGNVTGTVSPPEEVLKMTANGCGLTNREVVVSSTGTFSTRIEGAPGECTLSFSVETRNIGTLAKTFALSVTEAAPATGAPELVKVEPASIGATVATVRFVFSEIIRATSYEDPDGTGGPLLPKVPASSFLLYGPQGTAQQFVGQDGTGFVKPRRDPADNRAVLVDFRPADYAKASTAAVKHGAAEDLDPAPLKSLPGSAPLKEVQLAGARTDLTADLVSVGNVSSQNVEPGKFTATFTFEAAPGNDVTADLFGVVLADGRMIPAEHVTLGVATTARFALADARTPEGVVCTQGTCPTLQQALSGVRRGWVAATTTRPFQGATVAAEGLTDRLDLVSVTVDPVNGTADFTFDDNVSSANVSRFGLYTVKGEQLTPTAATVVSQRVVRVTAPVSKLVVGGSAAAGAATGATGQSAPAAVGVPQTFAAGEVTGPALVGGSAVFVGAGTGTKKKWTITWTFSHVVTQLRDTELFLFDTAGKYAAKGTNDLGVLASCAIAQGEQPKSATCDVELPSDSVPAVVSVAQTAVDSAGALPDSVVKNIERSVRP